MKADVSTPPGRSAPTVVVPASSPSQSAGGMRNMYATSRVPGLHSRRNFSDSAALPAPAAVREGPPGPAAAPVGPRGVGS